LSLKRFFVTFCIQENIWKKEHEHESAVPVTLLIRHQKCVDLTAGAIAEISLKGQ
jgi:hypothetical protein